MKTLFTSLFFVWVCLSAHAQTITFSFTGQPGSQESTAPSFVAPNWAATSITRGTGLLPDGDNHTMSAKSFVVNPGGIVSDEFYEFTITTPVSGGPHTVAGISFYQKRSTQGPQQFQVWTKIGAAAETQVLTGSVNTAALQVNIAAQSGLPNNTAYRVRIYPFNAGNASGSYALTSLEVLPVTFTDLTGKMENGDAVLKFTTEVEVNNSHFKVERSTDGRDFENIGNVLGSGTTNTTQRYTFTDEAPARGINYYRLRQIDYDGGFTLSKLITVHNRKGTFTVAPTLVHTEINVSASDAPNVQGTWQVFDLAGRAVMFGQMEAEQTALQIDMTDLHSGGYVLRLQLADEVHTERLVKL